jgi:hypothetical protein
MAIEDPFIGTGWSFPPAFDRRIAGAAMSSGISDIEESLRILFTTRLGERIMNPSYGCALDGDLFEPMNTSRISYLESLIRTAIVYHEPRIDADNVKVEPDSLAGILNVSVSYRVRGANSRFNFVYPYYRER